MVKNKKIVNKSGELLYSLVPEKKYNENGYRLYREKLTKFGDTNVDVGEKCGWISTRLTPLENITDFYLDPKSSMYDGCINNSIVYNSCITGSDSLIRNSTIRYSNMNNTTIDVAYVEGSTMVNSAVYNSYIKYGFIADSWSDFCLMEHGRVFDSNVDNSLIHEATIKDTFVKESVISADIEFTLNSINKAYIRNEFDYMGLQGIGSHGAQRTFTATRMDPNMGDKIFIQCGCWKGTLDEFDRRVKSVYGKNNQHYKEYMTLIDLVKIYFDKDRGLPSPNLQMEKLEIIHHRILEKSYPFEPIITYSK